MRVVASTAPAAGNGTMMRSSLDGYCCASAGANGQQRKTAASASAARPVVVEGADRPHRALGPRGRHHGEWIGVFTSRLEPAPHAAHISVDDKRPFHCELAIRNPQVYLPSIVRSLGRGKTKCPKCTRYSEQPRVLREEQLSAFVEENCCGGEAVVR